MYTREEYSKLKELYGQYSSWAIWDEHNEKNTDVIEENISDLNSRYVFLGLNISSPLSGASWSNFRAGKHDRKLKYACNRTSHRGSYLTDIFKGMPESKSLELRKLLTSELIRKNVDLFNAEMRDIRISPDTIFVLLGGEVQKLFKEHFKDGFSNKTVDAKHYSSYGTDKAWVEDLWKILGLAGSFEKNL